MDEMLRNSPSNIGMFMSALEFGMNDRACREAYELDTGEKAYTLPESGLDRIIDHETGRDIDGVLAFAEWFRKAQWGCDNAPDLDLIFKRPEVGSSQE
jgi:hypothetical protein